MYRYALLLLLFIITSCNAGRLRYVRQDRTVVSEEEIANVNFNTSQQITEETPSIRLSETEEVSSESVESTTSDIIETYDESVDEPISIEISSVSEDDTLYLGNNEVPADYKVEQALRSQRLAGVSVFTSIFSVLSVPLALLVAIVTWSGVGAGITLGLGGLLLIISWIALIGSATSRFSTKKAGRLRIISVVLIVLASLIAATILLGLFL